MAIGTAALANFLMARRMERRHPPRGKFIEVDGVRLHYIEKGSGAPVVLLHGNGAMAEDYAISGVLDMIARHHRVVAFDRPGFGYSERPRTTVWTSGAQADLLCKALRQLAIQRPVIVGHSWGTLVALSMALDSRMDTAAIVLLSGYYVPGARADVLLTAGLAVPLLGDVLRYTVLPLLGWYMAPAIVRKIFAPAPVTARFQARFPIAMALRPWQIRASVAETALMIPAAAATLKRSGELAIPVLIMAGAGDMMVDTNAQSIRLHRKIPQSDLRIVEGAGHMIHHTSPEAVAAAIREAVGPASAKEQNKAIGEATQQPRAA